MDYRNVVGVIFGAVSAVTTQFAEAEYLAFAVGENSEIPLPRKIDKIDAKYLLNIKWGDYAGGKSRIAVLEVDNNNSSSSFSMSGPNGQAYS